MSWLLFNKYKGDRLRVLLGEGNMARQCTQPKRPRNSAWFKEKMLLTDDLDAYDSDCDDISSAKAVIMANLSSYDSDVLFECYVEKKYFDIQKKELFLDNDRLLEHVICQDVMNIIIHADFVPVNVLPANNKCLVHDNLEIERVQQENDHLFELILSQDIVHTCVNSLATRTNCREMQQIFINEYNENLVLKAELAKMEHMVEKKVFDEVVLRSSRLENHCVNLELKLQHQKESFLNNKPLNNQDAPEIQEFFHINEWQAKLKAKDVFIANLKKLIENLKGKNVVEKAAPTEQCQFEHTRAVRPIDNDLDSPCKYAKRIKEVLVYVTTTCPSLTKSSEKLVTITPLNKNKKVRNEEFYYIIADHKPSSFLTVKKNRISANNRIRALKLYTLSLEDMMISSPIYLLSKASKTKSWLWHRHLSHLNFGTIIQLAKQGLVRKVRGLPKLKFEKDHLCSGCSMGKSKKHSHKTKFEDTNQEKLYLLHMDLCGPVRVESINGKKYILVIVNDYSQFTWVKYLRSKDEAPEFIIKFLKMIQV
ncbi:retrovirus-related pol polyprotein from transposon TNT 1-94 [Tanacetum coccineum]